jgi:two-component system, OmpR family, KDP operon response regulator KdpE
MMVETGAKGRRILAVDDELQILRALKVVLRSAGYAVTTAATMAEALDLAALSRTDAAIIDLLLPDGDGIELCRQLREWSSMPIILLSAIGDEGEKVRALRAGADDYVTKPFGPDELVARLEAVLRRSSPEPDQSVLNLSGLEVDLAAHVVRSSGETVHLTPTEFELLRVFVRNRGRLLTHRDLLNEVWGPEYAEDVTVLRGQIANLRRKLEPHGGPPRHYVRTEPGIGYRFDPA